ncbi:MAG TPA: tryptophan--tRNA ligase [Candidatus Paceibacterota bacterium]|nr:tryptophan--tRNA ligase [Candidatus Paceibacterota bacterium]
MAKPILFSGIQPTGRLHIGNYLGALKNFVELQNSGKYDCYFCIVDLHSLTGDFNPKEKSAQILDLAADFLAAGLDPKRSVIFQQSQVPAHSELTWILNTITPMGELERMTQFKDKSGRQRENVNVGLFDYPVLMATDILLYGTRIVPVGDDQLQHLELTRTLARKFNTRFGQTFTEPKALLTKTPRVMSLKDPTKKMSKSVPEGCLFLDDGPDDIGSKIARAVTDSGSEIEYDPERKPGLSNLLEIYAAFGGYGPEEAAGRFAGKNYSDFKRTLAELIADHFAGFRAAKKALLAKPATLVKTLDAGSKEASKIAEAKMTEIKEKVGLVV